VILDPDFLDHWKTRMLVDLLGGDECAPLYVIRMWGHCQSRRAIEFDIPAVALKAICRAPHDAETLESALIQAGFAERSGPTPRVPKWAEHNPKLVANWRNGSNGGRPSKGKDEPNRNPTITQPETQQEPNENPTGTQSEIGVTNRKPVGEGRVGEGRKNPPTPLPGGEGPPGRATTSEGFERFWSAYPRKCSKGQARKAWAKLKPSEQLVQAIIAGIGRAKTSDQWLRDDGRFIPHPATWLNAEGWLDDAPASRGRPDGQWWLAEGYGTRESAMAAGAREPA